uniref:Uncharacterized protein n=1 Tax=Romanomermis culicivorax TaxID=13658 RepID=A0A915IHN4_ROMCU
MNLVHLRECQYLKNFRCVASERYRKQQKNRNRAYMHIGERKTEDFETKTKIFHMWKKNLSTFHICRKKFVEKKQCMCITPDCTAEEKTGRPKSADSYSSARTINFAREKNFIDYEKEKY